MKLNQPNGKKPLIVELLSQLDILKNYADRGILGLPGFASEMKKKDDAYTQIKEGIEELGISRTKVRFYEQRRK